MDASPDAPRKCAFTVQIDAAVHEHAFHAPGFRFKFLDGSKKQTPALGAPGWTALESASGGFRFEHVVPDVQITETLARAIDQDPVVSFVLFDQPSTGAGTVSVATAAPVSAALKNEAKIGAATLPSSTDAVDLRPRTTLGRGKLIADMFDVDLSALFTGVQLVEQSWTDGSSAPTSTEVPHPEEQLNVFANHKDKNSRGAAATAARSYFSPASGVRHLTIRVLVDQPMLSNALTKKLNPITLTIGSIRGLPGIASRAPPHDELRKHCRPVYALWQFFPSSRLYEADSSTAAGASFRRIVLTPGKQQDESVEWGHTVSFLCGRCNPAELYDAVQSTALTVEIHDRDFFQEAQLHKLQQKWESLHVTGVDTTANNQYRRVPAAASDASSSLPTSPRTTTPRASGAHPAHPKPLDAFSVDEIAKQDWRTLLLRSGEFFAHGTATFRLTQLLEKAKALTTSIIGNEAHAKPYMSMKITSSVLANKRRASPIGSATFAANDDDAADNQADLTPIAKLVREPGAYVTSGTTLSLLVSLQHPLQQPGPETLTQSLSASSLPHLRGPSGVNSSAPSLVPVRVAPSFSRMVLIIPYKDTATLSQVMRVMEIINLQALPGIPIRSYQMNDVEKHACATGTLDVVTGVMIIDSDFRMVILEGLSKRAMARVYHQVPRKQANDPRGYRMYANDSIEFTQRLYTSFEIDLKRIKLRYPLSVLMSMPDIYMRTKVSEICYLALTRLADLRKVSRLTEVKDMDLFPSAAMLLEVESKYGESISLEDIYGRTGTSVTSKMLKSTIAVDGGDAGEYGDGPAPNEVEGEGARPKRSTYMRLKAPTDATNLLFEEYRRTRTEKDYLLERKNQLELQQLQYHKKREALASEMREQPATPVYLYSGQKLRTQDALQEELRKHLAKDRASTYTYGPDFQSLALSLVNPDELRQTEGQENRKKWTTQRGFVYPAPRPTAEYYKHPNAPSEARCEDLREPFVDNVNHPKPVSRDNNHDADNKTEFSTLPSKDIIFGGTNGDGTVNAEYFKSVHLCGEGLRQEMEEALKHEQDEWERKLVVDRKQIKFLAHGNICSLPRSKPSQLDKLTDILDGQARSKPLRIVRNATLPSGKRVPLQQAPASILSQHDYVGSADTMFATTLRQTDASHFVATDATGQPKDFHFPSTTDLLTPQVNKFITHKEIRPFRHQEKSGFLWSNHSQ